MPKKKTITLVIVFLLVDILSVGFFVFLYFFTTNMIMESVNTEDQVKIALKQDETRILLKDDLSQGELYQQKLMNYVIPDGGTVDFIKTIEQLVSNSGIKSNISSVADEPYDKGNSIGAELLNVDMDVIGEWKNIQFFLKLLENYPLKIDIVNASFTKVSDYTINGKKVPQWSASFEFTVVKMKDTK